MRLMGSFLKERISTFPSLSSSIAHRVASTECRVDGWNFSIHVDHEVGAIVISENFFFCLVNTEDCK